jgi:thiol:disulfide interchange protein DsbD
MFHRRLVATSFVLVAFAVLSLPVLAQNPVTIEAKLDQVQLKPGQKAKVLITAKLEPGWHLYALTQPPPPRAARVVVDESGAFKADGPTQQPKPKSYEDPNFSEPGKPFISQAFENEVTFTAPVKAKEDAQPGPQKLVVKFSYQVCDDHQCLRPTTKSFEFDATIAAGAIKSATTPTPGASPTQSATPDSSPSPTATPAASPSAGIVSTSIAAPPPAAANLTDEDLTKDLKNRGLFGFIWFAIIQGLLALLTPCVFPMIPITVSFFTKREKTTSAQAVGQATFFSVGIILTYTLLGLALALIAGPTGLQKLAASPWMNLFLTALFVIFALNLFGMFEIRVPTGLVSKLDQKSQTGGGGNTFATLLMGITFTLTSFTCTTAFVGTVLIYATQGDWFWAIIGMLAFATAFALPFFLFALFPRWLQSLPKSGGWLNSVKVVMGFLELAAAFKFLSNVDLVWGWQTVSRNLVIAAWIAIALMAAIYLLGKYLLPHDSPVERLGVPRMLVATFFFAAAFYLLTGLFGAPLGELDAWLPPMSTNKGALFAANSSGANIAWVESYEAAVQKAKADNKPVFLNFTGVTCTNCRWMEQNMFPDPAVKKELDRFVLAELFTDRETPEHQQEDERNGQLQTEKFGSAALPLYAIIDPSGNTLAKFPGLTRDKQEFIEFLQRGASRYQQLTAGPVTR